MNLEWAALPGGGEMACGDGWTYLIASDDRNVVLTRWETGPDPAAHEVASQAALYAIQLGGAYGTAPEAASITAVHLKHAAQEYESGLDVTGQRSWWH